MTMGELIDEYGWPPSMWPEEYRPKDRRILLLQEIRQEIENNMESIIGKYDANTSEHNMPSHKIERNNGRKECLAIINKHIKEIEG